jgi:general stress protein 26
MTVDEGKKILKELVDKIPIMMLSTVNTEGFPEVRAMLNLDCNRENPQKNIYIGTHASSRKIQHIKKNNKAGAYFCDTGEKWRGALLMGRIEIVPDFEIKKKIWKPEWTRYYPKGITDPEFTVLRLSPERVFCYYKLEKVDFELK